MTQESRTLEVLRVKDCFMHDVTLENKHSHRGERGVGAGLGQGTSRGHFEKEEV